MARGMLSRGSYEQMIGMAVKIRNVLAMWEWGYEWGPTHVRRLYVGAVLRRVHSPRGSTKLQLDELQDD